MGLKKIVKKSKRSVKKVTKTAKGVVKTGVNFVQKPIKSTLKNVQKLIGLKRKKRRGLGFEGTSESIAKLNDFTGGALGNSRTETKVTIIDTFSGLCFNGTKSNFHFPSPQCYDFDDNFIHFSSSISEKYDTETDEFIDLDLTNSFIDPTKKYPIKTIGTKYVGSGVAGLATGGKTCDDIECVVKPNLCKQYLKIQNEASIIRRAYEFNNITWTRRDDLPEGVAFHTGVGDEDNAIFWGGLHGSLEQANIKANIPGCDTWGDIINSFQGYSDDSGISGTDYLVYSTFKDTTKTNYGVTFTPILYGVLDKNYEVYNYNLVNTFDISGSLDQINSGEFSLHGGKLSYRAYPEDDENIKIVYEDDTIIVPKESYGYKHSDLCNGVETGFSQSFTEGVLLTSYVNDEEESIIINQAINKEKFIDFEDTSVAQNVAESEPIEDYWQISCITGDCECECDDEVWLQYEFACDNKIIRYEITSTIETESPASNVSFFPKEWILVGSNDPTASKEDWAILDFRDFDTSTIEATGYFTQDFQIQNPGVFKYYRIYFESSNKGIIRINQLRYLSKITPSVWLWTTPYDQNGINHQKTSEQFYIQPSSMVISSSGLEIVRAIKKAGGGARVTRAVMAGPDSSGIGKLNIGKSSGYCQGVPFDYGDIKKDIEFSAPSDADIKSAFPFNMLGDDGVVGPTGIVEMIDKDGNYWVAFGDSENKLVSANKDSDFINKYTIIMIPNSKLNNFSKTILAFDNYRHSNIQVNGFLRKDWLDFEINKTTNTYITLKGSRNREGFLELINSRIGESLFDLYIQIFDYNVNDPSSHSYTNKEINNPDPSTGVYDPVPCEKIDGQCSDNNNYFYINKDSKYYPILLTEFVTPKDSNCDCNFCSLDEVMVVDSSGNPVSFVPGDAPPWEQHNHTEWATSYLESPFAGPFSRENFNVWLSAGENPQWGSAVWSTVDKGEAWMHFRKTRYAVDEKNNKLVFIMLTSSFNMNTFDGNYRSVPTYFSYDEFIYDLDYYKPLKQVQNLLNRENKNTLCDDTLLTYVNPYLFIFCSEPKEIDVDNAFFKQAVSSKNLGQENSIEVNYLQDISGGNGFHSQSPFMVGPIEDDVIVYAGSLDGNPLTVSGQMTIVKGQVQPSYPFNPLDVVYQVDGGFSISEFGIQPSEMDEIPEEENENQFDEEISTAETSGERLSLGQRLILTRYRSSFGMNRASLNRRYPWISSYLQQDTPVYADYEKLSDRQRRILDKFINGNKLKQALLIKRHNWLKKIKIPPQTSTPTFTKVNRGSRSLKRNWRFWSKKNLEEPLSTPPPPIETPPITAADSPSTIPSGTELFTAEKGQTYWIFLGLPDGTLENSYNLYATGKLYYIPTDNNVQLDSDPDVGYTEWITCFVMEYKKREESEDGTERKYYYRYNVEDRESDTFIPKEQINSSNKDLIGTDWRRFQDGVGLGGSSVPILNNRFLSDIKCTNLASCAIGMVAFGDPDQAVICGGYKNSKDGVLSPTRSWWGLLTDMPTFKWNRFVINPEDTLNANYRRRNFSPFFNNGDQTLTDTIHSCILFDVSRPQTFERHGNIIFDNETEKEVLFEEFPEYVEEKDKYSITLVPTGNVKLWWSDKEENKFTINSEIEWSGIVDWKIIKVSDIPIEQIEEMDLDDTFEQYEEQ